MRMFSLKCVNIVLESKRREVELVLYLARVYRMMIVRIEGVYCWIEMKDCEWKWILDSVCRRDLCEKGGLFGYVEFARFLQMTYSKRCTIIHNMMNGEIGNGVVKWYSVKMFAVAYSHDVQCGEWPDHDFQQVSEFAVCLLA